MTFAWLAFFFVGLFLLERAFPLRAPRAPLPHRLVVNGALSGLTLIAALAFVRPTLAYAMELLSSHPWGIIRWLRPGLVFEAILTFLLLDLSFYLWHRLNHRARWLWRFHNVHHLDPDLDVSTSMRFHFGEVFLSAAFRAVQVLIIGPRPWMMAVYEVVFQAATYFHHSNVRLPRWLDDALARVVVTPRLHGVHHSQARTQTDSNFSVVLTLWDRWLGTFTPAPEAPPRTGVPGYDSLADNRLLSALSAPFRAQRPYW